ncbi:unnamed protein product [Tilletia controversa]|nr:unnamed protein product [Tilletia controversa]
MLLAPSLVRLSIQKNKLAASPVARARRVARAVMAGPRPPINHAAAAAAAAKAPFVSSPIPPPAHKGAKMDQRDGALVWIDCEMTGLTDQDRIIEIACIVTDGDLQPVDAGIQYVIQTPKEVLDAMGDCHADISPWWEMPRTDRASWQSLTALCLDPTVAKPHDHVRAAVFAYVLDRIPVKSQACLAGNSVHADKVFLDREMPELTEHLSYRIVDVSSIKASEHRALSDIKGSIEELKHYKLKYFRTSGPK